jgi:hypothetical protein
MSCELSKETLKNIELAKKEIAKGKTISHRELRKELGLLNKTNLVLMKEKDDIAELNFDLGFNDIFFLEKDFVLVTGKSKKEYLKNIKIAKKKKLLVLAKPETEELLRFLIERTEVDLIFGMEKINPKDSVHFPRGGLDQVICKLAADNNKILAFSFNDILNSKDNLVRAKLMNRIRFNIKLCKKYKVKTFFSNFAKDKMEMRSFNDLKAFWSCLGGTNSFEL